MRWRALALVLVGSPLAACAAILGIDDGIPREAGTDAVSDVTTEVREVAPACDLTTPFQTPVALSSLNTPAVEAQARLLSDELTVYFERVVTDAGYDLFSATRTDTSSAFGAPSPITELDTPYDEGDITVAPNALLAYYASDQPGGLGGWDIWQAQRDASTAPFGTIALTENVSSTQNDFQSYYIPGALYFASDRSGIVDIYRAAEQSGGFASPLLIPELGSPAYNGYPVVSFDELTIYLGSNRGDAGGFQIWTSSRALTSQPWPTPTLVTELASFGNTTPSWISSDGCRLYLTSDQSGNDDIYVASKSL
jgi:hypothetical protein